MPGKPIVLMEGFQLVRVNDRPHQLWGYATDHPHLPGFRRFIATSRVVAINGDEAETLNSIYRLRHPIEHVAFDGAHAIHLQLSDLVAEREAQTRTWRIRRDIGVLADGLASMSAAILAILAILDRESTDSSPR